MKYKGLNAFKCFCGHPQQYFLIYDGFSCIGWRRTPAEVRQFIDAYISNDGKLYKIHEEDNNSRPFYVMEYNKDGKFWQQISGNYVYRSGAERYCKKNNIEII